MVFIHFLPLLLVYYAFKWFAYPTSRTVWWTWKREDVDWYHGHVPIMFWFAFVEMGATPVEAWRWLRGWLGRHTTFAYRTLEASSYVNAEQMVERLYGRSWRRDIVPASWRWLLGSYRQRSTELPVPTLLLMRSDYPEWKRVLFDGRVYLIHSEPETWRSTIVHLGPRREGSELRIRGEDGRRIVIEGLLDRRVVATSAIVDSSAKANEECESSTKAAH